MERRSGIDEAGSVETGIQQTRDKTTCAANSAAKSVARMPQMTLTAARQAKRALVGP